MARICHGFGVSAQPGGEVGDAADRRVVEPTVEADPAQRRVALGDPDPESEVVPLPRPASARPRTRVRIATLIRIARSGPSSHRTGSLKNTIRPSPAKRSSVPSNRKIRSPSACVVLLQDAHHLLGLARLGERREAAQVAEHDDDLAPVALEERLVAGVDDQLGELRGQEPPEPTHPLELRDLRLDPRLQLAGSRRRARRPGA